MKQLSQETAKRTRTSADKNPTSENPSANKEETTTEEPVTLDQPLQKL